MPAVMSRVLPVVECIGMDSQATGVVARRNLDVARDARGGGTRLTN